MMINGRAIRCLLFDLGSTLWTRREDTAAQAERAAHERAGNLLRGAIGHKFFPTLDDGALGALLYQTIGKHMRQERLLRPGYEPDSTLATTRALLELGAGDGDRALAEAIFEALRVRIPASRVLFADTLSTLAALKARGYLLGVVTNRHYGGPLFREDVAVMGLLEYFEYEHMAISADLGFCKPHPAIFQHALTSLNVSPEEAAMVGDQLRADIAGAKELHIYAIWKPPAGRSAAASLVPGTLEPDAEIEHLSQLLEMF
jgi:HAD superfamily hydrolase (TIGR01509 family)